MQTNRLGCLTGTGILAALITILSIVGVAFTSGSQMFSAGALNAQQGESLGGVTAHAQIAECNSCHVAFWESATMAERCATCHTNVAAQLTNASSLHGTMLGANPTISCRYCHPEHRGASASLTEMDLMSFPHEALGFSLRSHQFQVTREAFTCRDCHGDDISRFDIAACESCHRQMDAGFMQTHVASFESNCLACHDGVDAYGDDFDHNDFAFSLQGKHAEAECTECHANPRSAADFKNTPQDCAACHQKDDPHAGAYGANCGVCHSPTGWNPAKFDHTLAAFKLEGAHANAKCEDCHSNNVFKGTPTDCYSCHKNNDEHGGQFGTDCSVCHTPSDWDSATFDHNLAAFKLEGAHVNVRCEDCHVNKIFKGTPSDCYSCHKNDDEHAGQFGTDCSACHTSSDWDNVTFNHNLSPFPLTGAHARINCEQCHQNGQFKGLGTSCVSCHADPIYHAGMFGVDCAQCHSTQNWFTTYNGPHPSFGDEGGGINHEGATCRDCHPNDLKTFTCLKCHDSNNPTEGREGEGND